MQRYRGSAAVDQTSFRIHPGEILGYLGPNGSGESTTVKCMVGLIDPSERQILFHGRSILDDSMQLPGRSRRLQRSMPTSRPAVRLAAPMRRSPRPVPTSSTLSPPFQAMESRNPVTATEFPGLRVVEEQGAQRYGTAPANATAVPAATEPARLLRATSVPAQIP